MYRLLQVGRLAHDKLVQHLKPHSYAPVQFTTNLWTNKQLGITFTLIVDNFGIKFNSLDHIFHLKNALEIKYTITLDLTGSSYIGVSLNWNYTNREVTYSMLGYILKLLKQLQYSIPTTPQYSPNLAPNINYGTKVQLATKEDTSPKLDKNGIKLIQSIRGAALYIACMIDITLLVTCNDIGIQQTQSTTNILNLAS